ncbi:MAG TPA: tRNA guanosine(34) transglycosylase Tgt [Bacteroidales bacterium]|nr:tRNA guanosine(34) transglycosylase Tgt [Bacteroidales bacterium]HRW96599.1 tRNA guanosine(34) transglycosylase Tgt [Bacteroidales bacterium]
MEFKIETTDKQSMARAGIISTDHGIIHTPIFMPVGTAGTVKAVHFRDISEDAGAEIVLGNTYHLYLRPGMKIMEQAGGLHHFNGWRKPLLTDSGGYQVFSLSAQRKIKEEGVHFRSHIDGSKHFFSPENIIDIQRIIGADIMMAFDECTPWPCDYDYARRSMELTHRWLDRCISRFENTSPKYGHHQSLFPIVQGSTFEDLRKHSAEYIASKNAEGNAIGGLSVGEPAEKMYEITELVCSILPKDRPRYLMGVGTPVNILESISLGIDMFDCVMPTRNGRNAMLFTSEGVLNMKNEKWKNDFSPIDPNGTSFVDKAYNKAFLRHLFISGEYLAPMIASLHNIAFYLWLVKTAREEIIRGTFGEWKKRIIPKLNNRL